MYTLFLYVRIHAYVVHTALTCLCSLIFLLCVLMYPVCYLSIVINILVYVYRHYSSGYV